MNLSVVIPAYNESDNIKATVEEILSVTGEISQIDNTEIIVVDDHSSDDTYDAISKINKPGIRCLRLSRRNGSHTAIRAGLKEASGDAVLCISADGQDDPSCLVKMLQKLNKGANVVWALRRNRENEPWYVKKPAQLFYKSLTWLGGHGSTTIDLSRADFYVLSRIVVDAINACSERNTSLFGLIAWLDFNQDVVEYERRIRRHGKSKWNFKGRVQLAKDWIVAFTGLPLRLITIVGFFISMIGFLYMMYIIVDAILGNPIIGWPSMMVTSLFLGGIQMMMLGVIGEYLWRNLDESRNRPLFFVEKKSKSKDD